MAANSKVARLVITAVAIPERYARPRALGQHDS
jgi:hypothetical protein